MKNVQKILLGFIFATIAIVIYSKSYAVHFYDTVGTRYEGAAERLAELNVVAGVEANIFEPNRTVTRAEFAKMLVMAAYKPAEYEALIFDDSEVVFKDIDRVEKAWYYEYVTAAVNAGLMKGYEDGFFRPNGEITYAEISKMVTLALGHNYLKASKDANWAESYISKMYEIGCFKGTIFNSTNDKATRGNIANIIWNMLNCTTWKMVYRNDKDGFSYTDSNQTLISQKVVDHVALTDASIDGFVEQNGKLYVRVNGSLYKLFDQSAKMNFSMIGGYSDVLLKRVEYPGKTVELEVVGISTDLGSVLYEGTYSQLREEGFDLGNKTKIGTDTDYAFLYHYENDSQRDRAVGLKWDKVYQVDEIKINDDKSKNQSEKDDSHTSPTNQFEDDIISFRYGSLDEEFTRTILINKDQLEISGGAVLFKNNQRVEWGTLKAGDFLVEIVKNKYYFVASTTTKEEVIEGYTNKKDDYTITTSEGKYTTYPNTMYSNYYSKEVYLFNKITDNEFSKIKDKSAKLIFDVAGRVIKIEAIENEIQDKDINFGIYNEFYYSGVNTNSKISRIGIIQNGKERKYQTDLQYVSADKGDLVYYTFDKDKTNIVKSVNVVKTKVDLTDKLRIELFDTFDLQKTVKFLEEDEITITRIKYHYAFGKYESAQSVDIEKITIPEYLGINDNINTTSYGILDEDDVLHEVYVLDKVEQSSIYYGIVKNMYREKKEEKLHVVVKVVGVRAEQDYELTGRIEFVEGDFIKFHSEKGETLEFVEKYSVDALGYYKDLEVLSRTYDKDKSTKSYKLSDGSVLDVKEWKIAYDDENEDVNLNAYDIFLIKLENTGSEYKISSAEVVKKSSSTIEEGDMLAIDEIDNAIVIYRGYKK